MIILTKLEHIIRESEYNGDISKETRDKLLLVIEHGGAHRKYLELLAKKEKDLKEKLKSAHGKEKQEIEQKLHDLSNKYLTYTNSGSVGFSDWEDVPDGVEYKYYKRTQFERHGNPPSVRYIEGDKNVDINKNYKKKKTEDKQRPDESDDEDRLFDYKCAKQTFKRDFSGPQKKYPDDKLHSRYKMSGSGPNQQIKKKSSDVTDIVKREKSRQRNKDLADILSKKEKIVKKREDFYRDNLTEGRKKMKEIGSTKNPIKKIANNVKKKDIAKEYIAKQKKINKGANDSIKNILRSKYKTQTKSRNDNEFDDELYE